MDIKLKARLSAYSKFPKTSSTDPSNPDCDVDVVTKEDIDSLFDSSAKHVTNTTKVTSNSCNSDIVTFEDIDSLFDK